MADVSLSSFLLIISIVKAAPGSICSHAAAVSAAPVPATEVCLRISLSSLSIYALLLAESCLSPSNPPEWLGALTPQLVLLSVAADDYQGRPDPAVLEALEGRTLLKTDRNGWVELITDGERMWVELEKR